MENTTFKEKLSHNQAFLQLDKQRCSSFKKSFTYFCAHKMLFMFKFGMVWEWVRELLIPLQSKFLFDLVMDIQNISCKAFQM